MGKIIKDGVEYDFGSDIIYHLISSGDSGDSKDITFIDLGSGTSFDVSSYDGYENFTVDNFVVKEITETSISKLGYNSGTATAAQNAVNLKSTMELVKEYDSSTGILTCYIKHYAYVKSSNTSSDAVTLTDTQNAPVNVLLVLNGTSDGSGDSGGGTVLNGASFTELVREKFDGSDGVVTNLTKGKKYLVIVQGYTYNSSTGLLTSSITGSNCKIDYITNGTEDGNKGSEYGAFKTTTALITDVLDDATVTTSTYWTGLHIIYEVDDTVNVGSGTELVDGNISLVYSKTSQSDISYTIPETGTYTIIATGSQTWLSEDYVTVTGFEADTTTTFTNDGSGPHCSKIAHNVQLNEGDVIGVSGCTNNSLLVYKAEVSAGSEGSDGGNGGNTNTVLLWSQDASGDGTAFNAQTLSLSELSKYDGVIIRCCLCNNSSNGYYNIFQGFQIEKGSGAVRCCMLNTNNYHFYRDFTVNDDSVVCSTGYNVEGKSKDGRYVYPVEIYGYTSAEIGGTEGSDNNANVVEEEKVLLWENTKPTSSFAAQTVTLSQSIEDFDWVEILVYQSTSLKTKPAVYRYQVEQLMDETFHMNLTNKAAFGFVNRCNSSGHFYSRAIGVTSSTGLFFSAALRRDKNTAFEETTAQLIPYQIYGVKNGVVANNIYPIFENGWKNGASLNSSSKCTVGENIVLNTTSSATEANFTVNIPDIENLLGICVEFSQTGGNTGFTLNMGQNTSATMPKGDNYTIFCKYVSGSVFSLNASCGATNTITINKIYAILDGGVISEQTSITKVNYGDFESFAKFVNNCNTIMGGLEVYIDDFSKVKSFTYEVTATNYGSYIRYKNDSGTITNIFGDNYTEHGISAGKSATITKTVNCEELNFDVGYPVFWALSSSTNITNLKITSYEMVDGYTYPEAGGSGSTTHDVKLEIQGGGAINAYVDIDGERVISYTQPSGTAWGGRVETAEFTCSGSSNTNIVDSLSELSPVVVRGNSFSATVGKHYLVTCTDEEGNDISISGADVIWGTKYDDRFGYWAFVKATSTTIAFSYGWCSYVQID